MNEATFNITVFVWLNVCHWIGDYTHAMRPSMLAAKKLGRPLLPIVAHAGVHAALMLVVCWALIGSRAAIIAFAIQLPTHFAIDLLKARCNVWWPALQSPANVFHWWIFGADQFAHQMVLIWITVAVAA